MSQSSGRRGRRASRRLRTSVSVRAVTEPPRCGDRITEHGGIEFGEWDFGDGRGIVAFEALVAAGECLCQDCRLTRALLASHGLRAGDL